ncbi:unnamed protein product [Pleuronectes platessa]|uniref:Uncharacterized protein n=1 Tax=Pleuronectes platessa TaxID=8262 RepID=A0A9N7Y7Q7_PLEPL|nr:unnamed protein product [Pleuronectes platessa]
MVIYLSRSSSAYTGPVMLSRDFASPRLVFGARSALAVAGRLLGRHHRDLLYWHAAVSRQHSAVTSTAFPVLTSRPQSSSSGPHVPVLRSSSPSSGPRPQVLVPASDSLSRPPGLPEEREDGAPESLSYRSPIPIVKRSGDGTRSGHRGNRKTDLEMLGCEVVMTTRKLLDGAHHLLLLPPPPPPPPLPSC